MSYCNVILSQTDMVYRHVSYRTPPVSTDLLWRRLSQKYIQLTFRLTVIVECPSLSVTESHEELIINGVFQLSLSRGLTGANTSMSK